MALSPSGLILAKGPRCNTDNKYGIFSVVDNATNMDPHWMSSGFEYEDSLCGPPQLEVFRDECPPESFTKDAQRNSIFCNAEPFVVVGSYKCPPVGRQADEAFEIARQRLLKWEEFMVEFAFSSGSLSSLGTPLTPSLPYGNPDCGLIPIDLNEDGAVGPIAAIALLEEALGATSGCGIIHVPSRLAPFLDYYRLLEKDGDGLYTPEGYPVSLGRGYASFGPGGTPPVDGEKWIYATGPILMAKSNMIQVPENIAEGVNRSINDVEVRAERFYALGFSCALFAVRVNLCDPCILP